MLAQLLAPARFARCLGSSVPYRGPQSAWAFLRQFSGGHSEGQPSQQQLRQTGSTHQAHRQQRQNGIAKASPSRLQHGPLRRGKERPRSPLVEGIRSLSDQGRWGDVARTLNDAKAPTDSELRAVLKTVAYKYQPSLATTALKRLQGMVALTAQDFERTIMAHMNHPSGALKLLNEMEKAKDSKHAGDSRGGSERALEWLQLMEDTGHMPEGKHFTAAMGVCTAEGNSVNALKIFQQMRDQGQRPNIISWNALVNAIGSTGQVDQMMAMYREMRASRQQPDNITMNTMLACAGAAGRGSIAQDIWKEMHTLQLEPDVRSYNALINCYATAMEPEKAEAVLAEICQSATVRPNVFTFNSIVKAYNEVQRLDDAEQVISRMRAAGVQPGLQTWNGIIHAADAAGDVKRADRLYSDALLSGTIKPYRPWHSASIMKQVSGTIPPKGTLMDLHLLNPGTGRAAIRHELHERQKDARRRKLPLYIIAGHGGGLLVAAVSDTLKSQGILFVLQPGVVYRFFS
ncbi:hypothetical protein JKP88DRAFT_336767 [Tribonema minus]|uniref:PROP1-like PPR domain-containing protein n=1 Tax=Tribonema minus TaxID=303371 RepID=A0A835YRT0_9STRA|nr:hypothetical protein JKP88DRAFT_336767 [Tribonema minus]